MIRPVFTELVLFLTPFAVYAVFLFASRATVFDRASWSPRALAYLLGTALLLMIASFVLFAEFTGAPPGSTYEPAHIEDGKFVPGRVR
jgi:hypothetical protein